MDYQKKNEYWIAKEEEDLLSIIAPDAFLDEAIKQGSSLDSATDDYLMRALQNELHFALQSFVNGGFSNAGFLFYPFAPGVSSEILLRIKRMRRVCQELRKREVGEFSCLEVVGEGPLSCATFLSCASFDHSLLKKKNGKMKRRKACPSFSFEEYDPKERSSLGPLALLEADVQSKISPYIDGYYLHGSLASKDYVKGWSDCDTLLLISEKTMRDPKSLLSLRKKNYLLRKHTLAIDPLGHHGSIVINADELKWYPQTYFPIKILDYAKSLLGEDSLREYYERGSKEEALSRLFWFVSYFRGLKKSGSSLSLYELKEVLHYIALIPSLSLQIRGIFEYKKFSFDLEKKNFSKKAWNSVNIMTDSRKNWRRTPTLAFTKLFGNINPLPPYHLNSLIMGRSHPILKKINQQELIGSAHQLCEEAWQKAIKRA